MATGGDGGGGPARGVAAAAVALVVVGALEAGLASLATSVAREQATCPDLGGPFGCGAIVRPRVAGLVGPLTVTHLAVLGAFATLGLGLLLLAPPPGGGRRPPALLRLGTVGLGLGAGLALGVQPLGWLAAGAACPLCLALAGLAALAFGLGLVAAGREGAPRRPAALAAALALALAAPAGAARGRALAADDAARVAAARAFLAAPREGLGPRVALAVREDCPWCRALLADVVADPRAQAALARAGAIEVLDLGAGGDARARALGVRAPPTLVVVGPDGAPRGRPLEGYAADPAAWAREVEARLTAAAGP